jgi:glucose/arabinose dehydrogenase
MRTTLAVMIGMALAGGAAAQTPSLTGVAPQEVVSTGLSYAVAVRHAKDGTGRIYVVEKTGRVEILDRNFVISATPLIDVASLMPSVTGQGDERGLLGLAFDPDYSNNRTFYLYYIDTNSDTVVARFVAPSDGSQTPANSGTTVLRIDQPFTNHNGGDIHFGPDNMLYIGMGDGGSSNDPCGAGQTLDTRALNPYSNGSCNASTTFTNSGGQSNSRGLLGKMLRIDVRNIPQEGVAQTGEQCGAPSSGNAQYRIPATGNPYSTQDFICDEVLHYGLRNPYRFSFDRATGDMFIGDVGQGAREEISYAAAATSNSNFGWRCREGNIALGAASGAAPCRNTDPPLSNLVEPIISYDRSNGACSVTGGFRFRGPVQTLNGAYFYGDYCNGRITAAASNAGVWSSLTPTPWTTAATFTLAGFGEDEAGWVYYTRYTTTATGGLFRIYSEQVFRDGFGT